MLETVLVFVIAYNDFLYSYQNEDVMMSDMSSYLYFM